MRFEFIRVEKVRYPVRLMCRLLRVSASGFYSWLRQGGSVRERSDREILRIIREVFQASRETYGSPRVHEELRADLAF